MLRKEYCYELYCKFVLKYILFHYHTIETTNVQLVILKICLILKKLSGIDSVLSM